MIRNNLANILAEQQKRSTKVAEDTGLSRSTIHALYYNNAKGIQFDVLDKLCSYLSVSPESMIQYTPANISFSDIDIKDLKNDLECYIKYKNNDYIMTFEVSVLDHAHTPNVIKVVLVYEYEANNDDYTNKIIASIPKAFFMDFKQELSEKYKNALIDHDASLKDHLVDIEINYY